MPALKRDSAGPPRADSPTDERLRAENAALRAEVERLRARYERPADRTASKRKARAEPEPEQFALVGPGERKRDTPAPSEEALESVGEMLCRMLQERRPGTRWNFYRDAPLIPDGVTFFYAHEVLRKMWGETPGNPDPPTPQAYRRVTSAERDERDTVLRGALSHVDEALERSQELHAQGHVGAAVGLLKYVDLLLARFNLALAQAHAGNRQWQEALDDPERDGEFEQWLAQQVSTA